MLERSTEIFARVQRGDAEAWAQLEKELVLEFEYTSWPILSDETLGKLTQVLCCRGRRVVYVGPVGALVGCRGPDSHLAVALPLSLIH